jgi:hypothetical protein
METILVCLILFCFVLYQIVNYEIVDGGFCNEFHNKMMR